MPLPTNRAGILRRAAEQLERTAEELFNCHTVAGQWVLHDAADERAAAEHKELIYLASELRFMATIAPS